MISELGQIEELKPKLRLKHFQEFHSIVEYLWILSVFWNVILLLTVIPLCVPGGVYAWGMGTSQQLGQSEDDDLWEPQQITGKQVNDR